MGLLDRLREKRVRSTSPTPWETYKNAEGGWLLLVSPARRIAGINRPHGNAHTRDAEAVAAEHNAMGPILDVLTGVRRRCLADAYLILMDAGHEREASAINQFLGLLQRLDASSADTTLMATIACIIPGPTVVRRQEEVGVKWCFGCRAHLPHTAKLLDYDEPSYYEPVWVLDCSRCGQDRTTFPGYA